MLQVVSPVAFVGGSIRMGVLAVSMGFVPLPSAFVLVSVDMPKHTLAMSLVILPVALVLGSIGPYLDAESMPDGSFPLAFIPGPIFKNELIPLFAVVVVLWLRFFGLAIPIVLLLKFIVLVIANASEVAGASETYSLAIHATLHTADAFAHATLVIVLRLLLLLNLLGLRVVGVSLRLIM